MENLNIYVPVLAICATYLVSKYMEIHHKKLDNIKIDKLAEEIEKIKKDLSEVDSEEIDRMKSQINSMVIKKGFISR